MNTHEMLAVALECAGLSYVPADSGVVHPREDVKKILTGIDITESEMLLAKELGIDTVFLHHPTGGRPRMGSSEVLLDQIPQMVRAGVPINKAQKALCKKRYGECIRRFHALNVTRSADAAAMLGLGMVACHTPADLVAEKTVQSFLDGRFAGRPHSTLGEVVDALLTIPEYKNCLSGPVIRVGSRESYAGKILVQFSGGTTGGPDVIRAFFSAGVGTLVMMHCPDDVIEAVKEQNIGNILVAGHISSDSIGMNGILKVLEEQHGIEVVRCSGLIEPR